MFLLVLVVAATLLSMLLHFRSMSQRRNTIDAMAELLGPVLEMTAADARIAVVTDRAGMAGEGLVSTAQFVMVPRVLVDEAEPVEFILVLDGSTWMAARSASMEKVWSARNNGVEAALFRRKLPT